MSKNELSEAPAYYERMADWYNRVQAAKLEEAESVSPSPGFVCEGNGVWVWRSARGAARR